MALISLRAGVEEGTLREQLSPIPRYLSIEDGLSQIHVIDIIQDRRGFIWIATMDGLNRYDGYEFAVFRPDPDDPHSLSDNFIRSLCEDRHGHLWIGTDSGGLNRYDPTTGRFRQLWAENLDITGKSPPILSILEVAGGRLWLATGKDLRSYDPVTRRFQRLVDGGGDEEFGMIYEDRRGLLWVSSSRGLRLFDPEDGLLAQHFSFPNHPDTFFGEDRFCETEDGTLWLGNPEGFFFLSPEEDPREAGFRRIEVEATKHVMSIVEQDGKIWLGGNGQGLYDPASGEVTRYFERKNRHFRTMKPDQPLMVDRSGLLWSTLGSRGGLLIFDPRRKFEKVSNHVDGGGMSGQVVYGISGDLQGRLWIATNGGGLNVLEPETGQFRVFGPGLGNRSGFASSFMTCILPVEEDRIWVGTALGLDLLDTRSGNIESIPFEEADQIGEKETVVCSLFRDQQKTLWIGTENGLGVLGFGQERVVYVHPDRENPRPFSDGPIRVIRQGPEANELWIGIERGGLVLFDKTTLTFRRFRHEPDSPVSLSNDRVISLLPDPREGHRLLWVGTRGGGLNGLDVASGDAIRFREKDGLPNDTVYGILADDEGYLWMSTNKGLTRFHPRDHTFENFDRRDGLQGDEFNTGAYFRGENGRLFFGGMSGVTTFLPDEIGFHHVAPRVVLTDFQLFGQSVATRDTDPESPLEQTITTTSFIGLDHNQSAFSFRFAATDYLDPLRTSYHYMLEGFDKEWRETGADQRQAVYTNMDPGDYRFRVKARNRDGIWSEEEVSLELQIHPPFWRTPLAYLTYALLLSLAVASYLLWQRAIKRRLEQMVAERTSNLLATQKALVSAAHRAGKSEIVVHVLHNLGNALNSIFTSSQSIRESAANRQWHERLAKWRSLLDVEDGLPLDGEKARMAVEYHERIERELLGEKDEVERESIHLQHALTSLKTILAQHDDLIGEERHRESTDLNRVIAEVLETRSYLLSRESIEVIRELGLVPPVLLEQDKFRLMLQYLLENAQQALKSRLEGQKTISLETYCDQSSLVIAVRDNGEGIEAEHLPMVIHQGFSTREDGAGLGLHFAALTMQDLGGSIQIESDGPGSGTTVRLSIPMD